MRAKIALTDEDKQFLQFACCTYALQKKYRENGLNGSIDGQSMDSTSQNDTILSPIGEAGYVDRSAYKSSLHTSISTNIDPLVENDTSTIVDLPMRNDPIVDVLHDAAARWIFSTEEVNFSDMIHLSFVMRADHVTPTPKYEDVLHFWCDVLIMGLRGQFNETNGWHTRWPQLVEFLDTMIINYVCPYQSDRTLIYKSIDRISIACTSNKDIGKVVLQWVMEVADMVK